MLVLSANSDAVTIEYNGTITGTPFGSSIASVGDLFTVSVTFPELILDTDSSPTFGSYRAFGGNPGVAAIYQVNGNLFEVPATNYFDVFIDNPSSSASDRFEFEAFTGVNPGSGTFFNLFLADPSRTALTSDDIPMTLELSSFTATGSNLRTANESYQGSITSFSYTIPEPNSVVTLSLGVVTLLLLRKRA